MILTAHQPVYLPWLGLLHKIALSDVFCIFDDVQYLKKDWNNRNKIKTKNGPVWLTVPVLTSGHREKAIREIEINNSINWKKKHWKTIQLAYKKSPFFSRYADFFKDLYQRDWTHLVPLNDHILCFLLDMFGIEVEIRRACDEEFQGKKSGLVLDMCKKYGADVYIFGTLGRNYSEIDDFKKEDIGVYFQEYKHPAYSQMHGAFLSNMSSIDLLFNHGDKGLEIITNGNINKAELQKQFV